MANHRFESSLLALPCYECDDAGQDEEAGQPVDTLLHRAPLDCAAMYALTSVLVIVAGPAAPNHLAAA